MQKPLFNLAKQQISERVAECIHTMSIFWQRKFPMPEIVFSQRGKIAGSARLQKNELRFNPVLLVDNLPLFLNEVVPHEVCHLAAFRLFGKVKPHGREWQQLMRDVYRLEPNTYHTMDVAKVAGQKFTYLCLCGPIQLSIRRHNKVLKKTQQYRCIKCGQQLVAAEERPQRLANSN